MAKNDTIILDGILDERVLSRLPSEKRDEAFEYFAIEQILKDSNLSKDDILSGWVDGRNDGGIDGFYVFVNGHLLSDPESFFWPRTNGELEVHLITCKHHDTFRLAPMNYLAVAIGELFDFSIEKNDLKERYNEEVLKSRELFKFAYRKLASKISSFAIKISYASRGDSTIIGEEIISRGNQIKSTTEELFGACKASILYYGSTELVELSRKVPNFSLELPLITVMNRGERYVLLSKLSDYFKFVSDDSGKLRRYLFDSNVRDFMGLNRVNEDIKLTLENVNSPDFWWLNNGITILATSAQVIGSSIHIEDIQIVNGLQTTESLYKYFSSGQIDPKERAVLVKVVVSKENVTRDAIIRATNNQTIVEISALHATDKIQRDIEDVLLRNGIYYERRINFYANQSIKSSLIVTPLYLASGYLSLILKNPDSAAQLKSKFMRSPSSYEKIFSEKVTLEIWPVIAKILKRTDCVLETLRPTGQTLTENFLKRWRHTTSFLTISRLLGKFDFGIQDLVNLNIENFSDSKIKESWLFIHPDGIQSINKGKWLKKVFIWTIFDKAASQYNITGLHSFIQRPKWNGYIKNNNRTTFNVPVSPDFIEKVNQLLPNQPWKPGIKKIVMNQLNCSYEEFASAINVLIAEGKRLRQKKGVLYNKDNNIVGFDSDRVNPDSLKLKNK